MPGELSVMVGLDWKLARNQDSNLWLVVGTITIDGKTTDQSVYYEFTERNDAHAFLAELMDGD